MRISRANVVALALALAIPIGVGCSGGSDVEPATTGGSATGHSPEDMSVTSTGSGIFPPPASNVWNNQYGDAQDQRAEAASVNAAGEIAIVGTARGTIDFGNLPWKGTTTDTDVVVAKLTSKGQSLWSRRYGDSCDQHGGAVAHTPAGNMLIAGNFCGKMDFGATTVETKGAEVDVFVAVLDTLGEDIYSRRFGGQGAQIARAAAVDAQGNAVIVGTYDQAFDDGSGEVATAGLDDVFVIKLDPKGDLIWSRRFGGSGSDLVRTVAVDPAGNVIVGGSFGADIDFGGGPLKTGAGHRGAYLLVLDPQGNHLSSRTFGDPDDASVNAVTVDPTGHLIATGYFAGTVDIDGNPVVSAGGNDIFLASLDLDGKSLWSRTYGGKGSQSIESVSLLPNVGLAVAGTTDEVLDFGMPGEIGTGGGINNTNRLFLATFSTEGTFAGAPGVIVSSGPSHIAGIGASADLSSLEVVGSFQGYLHTYLLSDYKETEGTGGWDIFAMRTQ